MFLTVEVPKFVFKHVCKLFVNGTFVIGMFQLKTILMIPFISSSQKGGGATEHPQNIRISRFEQIFFKIPSLSKQLMKFVDFCCFFFFFLKNFSIVFF